MSRAIVIVAVAAGCALAAQGARAAEERTDAIAVATFRADGVDAAAARVLTDILAAELEKFDGVEVVSPSDIAAVLSHAANQQMLGCVEGACLQDFADLLPTRRLLSGSVGRVGSTFVVSAALIDLQALRTIARVSAPVGSELDSARAGLKTIALAVVTGDPSLLPDDAALKGEVSADVLDRLIIAERPRGPSVRALGGTVLSMTFAVGEPSDPHYPGGAGRLALAVPLWSWWSAVVAAGGSYHTGELLTRASLVVPDGDEIVSTAGAFRSALGIGDVVAAAGVQVQPPTGIVRPFVQVLGTADWLVLDVADSVFEPDDGQPDLPDAFAEPTRFRQSTSFGGGAELVVGVDFSVLTHLALSAQLGTHVKLHGLEKVAKTGGTVQTSPLPTLVGAEILLGVSYEL